MNKTIARSSGARRGTAAARRMADPSTVTLPTRRTSRRNSTASGGEAQAIVEYRQKEWAVSCAEDLLKVQAIGERVLEQNRANLRFSGKGALRRRRRPRPAAPQKPPAKR